VQNTYENTTISTFLEELSSAAPAPGGGSVAALSGAMAAALVLMVCNLTSRKERFAESEREIKAILEEALKLREELMNAVDEDIQVYNAVIDCYRLPKGSQEEKSERKERLQAALKRANEVPYRTAKTCYRVLELNHHLPQIGNPNAISDVAVSAQLAEAALQSALYNVDINCNYIKDESYVSNYREKRAELAKRAENMKQEIIDAVQNVLCS